MANPPAVRTRLADRPWRERYEQLAEEVSASAPAARPVLISSNVVIDDIYVMSPARLRSLRARSVAYGGRAAELVQALDGLLSEGRDGELFEDWPQGQSWFADVLGPADRVQVGGTGAQAAWALDMLGAPTVMSLESRSSDQLGMLAPGILVCRQGRTVPVREVMPDPGAKPARNNILEVPGGSGRTGRPGERAHRFILRFSPIPIERDEEFMALQHAVGPGAGSALLAGFNGLGVADRTSVEWGVRLLRRWQECGPDLRHVELGDTPFPGNLKTILAGLRGLTSSMGLSLSELLTFWGPTADIAVAAQELALELDCPCIVVHADRWSLAVHHGDPDAVVRRLMTGNLLASARAAAGTPPSHVAPVSCATYDEDVPSSGNLEGQWRVDCAPTPFVARPASTIGLGDTFTAGLLLAAAIGDDLLRDLV